MIRSRPSRSRWLGLLCLAAVIIAARPALAVRLPAATRAQAERDVRRFGSRRTAPQKQLSPGLRRAFAEFNRRQGGRWKMRFNGRTGAAEALVEGRSAPRPGRPHDAATAFLGETRDVLRVDPANLALERQTRGEGMSHLLYRQTYQGLPVEFSRVKVHLSADGSVLGLNSSYETDLDVDVNPTVTAAQAAAAVLGDNGRPPSDSGALVVFPDQASGRSRLAWKFTAPGKAALWRYYVDAHTGEIIFRYNELRFQAGCGTSGTISGMIYPVSPAETAPVQTRFNNQNVYIADGNTKSVTYTHPGNGAGFFCNAQPGKIITSLQGPWVNVSSFLGPSAHYDNGGGVWTTAVTQAASPHPYPAGAVIVSTISLAHLGGVVKFLPIFSQFHVGEVSQVPGYSADISDDDQLSIFDAAWNPVASYVGQRPGFNGAAVYGNKLFLKLRSNSSDGGQYGYNVSLSSYLYLTSDPNTTNPAGSSLVWQPENTPAGRRSEISLFYHLNRMHDYFMSDVNKSSAAWLGNPVSAMAFVGPNLDGAFYNPLQDNLAFGDGGNADAPSDALTDDATVPSHEYTHYVVEKIWPIVNFGQGGAISEAMADYFAASSLNRSAIGKYYNGGVPLRELDSQANPSWKADLRVSGWRGDLYLDSLNLSQALWDLRSFRIADQGSLNAGRSCVDGLAFQSLLFFPESFQEFLDAMHRVDSEGRVAACGGSVSARIDQAFFTLHGIGDASGDALEGMTRNDGFQTAVDVSTRGSVSATIYPAGDFDFYTFGAGAGPMRIALALPFAGAYYKAYMAALYDRNHAEVARVEPPYDGYNTQDGLCTTADCSTTQRELVLTYNNPGPNQFFLAVSGGVCVNGSNSGVNDPGQPYGLEFVYPPADVFSGSIVEASHDRDRISFNVGVTNFPRTTGPGGPGGQNYYFAYAQLRDHAYNVVPFTDTRDPVSGYLSMISSANAQGTVSGVVALKPGFGVRFPALGTAYLEVFGYNVLGSTVSLGLSSPLHLTANSAGLNAYNNVFNPGRGEKASVKYEITDSGRVKLRIFTLSGTLVATLIDENRPAGKGSVDWRGLNSAGSKVASGVYLLHLSAPGIEKTQKIVVVK
ncbi:MAG TPA: hypothetical protein DEB40_12155 [Elusimicrobia bacterium]|nr:hypothetical protein [Elusimicrobiota bacterium]HBT62487.1 hypothetical protein [Elusimicrobiota bacterium]